MDAPRRLLQRAFVDTDARRREVRAPSHRSPQRRTDTVPAFIVPLARWRTFWSHALRRSLENHKPRRRNTVCLHALLRLSVVIAQIALTLFALILSVLKPGRSRRI